MDFVLPLLIGLLAGLFVATLWERRNRNRERGLREEMREAFKSLASDALQANTEQVLAGAKVQFEPFAEQLKTLEEHTRELEKSRQASTGALRQQLDDLQAATLRLGTTSENLATALTGSSQVRGNWGETQFQNLLEMAGMQEHCDFESQETISSGLRPDYLIRLPGGDRIPVDAKAPLAAYQRAVDEKDPKIQAQHLKAHAQDLRAHAKVLAGRDYASDVGGRVDFVVMFVPMESVLAAAFQAAPDIHEEAMRQKVLIASPVTLLALLRTIAVYWRQDKVEENARALWEAAAKLHKRLETFQSHLAKMGRGLGTAFKAYDDSMGSWGRMVIPAAREVEKMGITDRSKGALKELPEVPSPRQTTLGGEEEEEEAGA